MPDSRVDRGRQSVARGRGPRAVCVLVVAILLAGLTARSAIHAAPSRIFVYRCGLALCLDGHPFVVHGATAYRLYGSPSVAIALARRAGDDVLELSEFDAQYHSLAAVESPATWDRVDRFIAAVGRAGLHVILTLSEYGQSLAAAGRPPTTADWGGYLRFIADRRNTVTGVRYRDDPTIAMVLLYGEIPAPRSGASPIDGTSEQLTAFFRRSLAEWRRAAPEILVSTGGFSFLNEAGNGIDWRTITTDPDDATCDIEVNSAADVAVTVPLVTRYCERLHKPWFLAAWSSCLGHPRDGYDYFSSDQLMAAHARAMYTLANGGQPAATPAIGSDFWNLGGGPAVADTCSIGPAFPRTLQAIRAAG